VPAAVGDRDKIAQAACAFANAGGGFIIFGMKDAQNGGGFDQGVEPIHNNSREPVKSWIEKLTSTLLEPALVGCQAKFIPVSGLPDQRGILVLQVPESDPRPHWVRGGREEAHLRVGEHSDRMARRTFIDLLNYLQNPKANSQVDENSIRVEYRLICSVWVACSERSEGRDELTKIASFPGSPRPSEASGRAPQVSADSRTLIW